VTNPVDRYRIRKASTELHADAMVYTRNYFVYILASRSNGTLYVGLTGDLRRRVSEHKNGTIDGFTKDYAVHGLVWFEVHRDAHAAIHREKCIKNWRRSWKLDLIEAANPHWDDLFDGLQ
jgi:putative endonuclease